MRKFTFEVFVLLVITFAAGLFTGGNIERTKYEQIMEEFVPDTIIVQDTLYVHLTEENVLAELVRQEVPHANIVLAQSKLETANYTSRLCRKQNNLFGMRKGDGYRSYENWQESIIDYKRRISSKYKSGSYYEFLEDLGYAEDSLYTTILKGMV